MADLEDLAVLEDSEVLEDLGVSRSKTQKLPMQNKNYNFNRWDSQTNKLICKSSNRLWEMLRPPLRGY